MARTDPQLNIRIPEELKDAMEAAAKESGRSVTAEIIHRLQQSFAKGGMSNEEVESLRLDLRRQTYLASRFEMVAESTTKVLALAGRMLHETIEQFPEADKAQLVDETTAKIIAQWVVPTGQGAIRDILNMLDKADEVKDSLNEFLRRLEVRDGVAGAKHELPVKEKLKKIAASIGKNKEPAKNPRPRSPAAEKLSAQLKAEAEAKLARKQRN